MSITRFEDGMYRNVNPKFIELLEYELDEVIGHTTFDLKLYKSWEERVQLLESIRSNNGKWNYETQLSTKSGRLLDVSIAVVEIELDGEPHILSMIVDITERNRILAALRASEQQLRTLFDVLPVGISYVSQDRKVIEHNRTLEKILDLSREALLSGAHESRQYIRPDGSPMPESEFASARALREQRTINNVEIGIIKEGGQVIWTSVSATPISMPEPGVVVITVDVTERKHIDDELRRSHRRYQMLSRRLVEIQEEERRTISRELHDRVGQSLAALNLNLSVLNNSLSGTSSLQIKSRLKDAIQLTEETVSTIRDVMADLRPPALDDYGLEAALNAYTDIFSRRFGIRVVLAKPPAPLLRLNPSIELTLLRIAQEALTNVARHANATLATVTLVTQDDMVYLGVEDNGEGIQSWQMANRPGSHGLKIMRERAETFGGTLQVQSFHRQGTKIEVKIPIRGNEQPSVRTEAD
jgi:PAS domain S-box-containing protein